MFISARAVMASTSAVACLLAGGCATITRGTTTDVVFQSEPPGAAMETTHGFWCTTPCTLRMARSDAFVATFTLEGYEPQSIPVQSEVSGGGAAGLAGNLLIGGVIGGVVDATSGAMNDLIPNPVLANLVPLSAAASAPVAPASASSSGE